MEQIHYKATLRYSKVELVARMPSVSKINLSTIMSITEQKQSLVKDYNSGKWFNRPIKLNNYWKNIIHVTLD